MSYKLLIAEKPSVAGDIAKVIGATERIRDDKGMYWKGNGYIVTNCVGHLVTLSNPEAYDEDLKKWSFDTLPFLPENYKFEIIPSSRKQYELVKKLMLSPEVSEIIVATDAGREGCAIYGYVAAMVRSRKPEKRLWISSMTDTAIREGMKNLKDNAEYQNMYQSALCRAMADDAVGINFTRYNTLRFGGYGNIFNTGRVQTATLALIIDREKKIKDFKPQKFYEVFLTTLDGLRAKWTAPDGTSRLNTPEAAQQIKDKTKAKLGRVIEFNSNKKTKNRPHLYNLNDLQGEGNRKYGYSAKQVLDIVQSLYETHKISTYPRTDSRYLNDDMVPDLQPALEMLLNHADYCEAAQDVLSDGLLIDKNVVDNSKVTDHHAIIFTDAMENFNFRSLSQEENNILKLIIVRFMEALSQKMEYQEVTCKIDVEGENFKAVGRKIIKKGFSGITERYFGKAKAEDEESCLDNVTLGSAISGYEIEIKEGLTSPPAHYTDETLLSVMENPHTQLTGEEKEEVKGFSLGTSATRADILEKLITAGYIVRENKKLLPLPKGEFLIEHVDETVKNPILTANWERKLQLIADGQMSPDMFMNQIREYVKSIIKDKSPDMSSPYRQNQDKKNQEDFDICPLCGAPVKETMYGWCCSGRIKDKTSCNFNINKNDAYINKLTGKAVTAKMTHDLIKSGSVTVTTTSKKKITLKVEEYKGAFIQWGK
ncbi:MAG: DNA topoisomerase 3 [Lachnospiraceae bacterium]|nr:DNA topoisomerase 3 [Lachnospiraceae bacterium]